MENNFNIYFKYALTIVAIFPIILLLVIQPDIGQTLLVLLSWATLVFISGISLPIIITFLVFIIITALYGFFNSKIYLYKK